MRTLRLALALVLAAPAALSAQQQAAATNPQRVSVVVFPFSAVMVGSDGKDLADVLRGMIITEIAQQPQLRTFERQELDEIVKQQRQSLAGRLSDEEAVRIGHMIGADYAFMGGIIVTGKDARIDLRVVNNETGEGVAFFKEKTSPEDFASLVDRIGQRLAELKPLPRKVIEAPIPVKAALAYSRGLDYEKRGNKAKAGEMFRAALQIHPEYAQAKAALGRVN